MMELCKVAQTQKEKKMWYVFIYTYMLTAVSLISLHTEKIREWGYGRISLGKENIIFVEDKGWGPDVRPNRTGEDREGQGRKYRT